MPSGSKQKIYLKICNIAATIKKVEVQMHLYLFYIKFYIGVFDLFSFYISNIMEDILLGDAGIGAERGRIKVSSKVGVYRSLHPNVDRKCFKISKSKEGTAGGNLVANALYLFKLRNGKFV